MVEAPDNVIKSPEQYFLDFFLKEKGGKLTVEDALSYNDVEKLETWLGPDMDSLGLLDKYCWLGFVKYDQENGIWTVVSDTPGKQNKL